MATKTKKEVSEYRKQNTSVTFDVPNDVYNTLVKVADKEDRTLGWIIRDILIPGLEKRIKS